MSSICYTCGKREENLNGQCAECDAIEDRLKRAAYPTDNLTATIERTRRQLLFHIRLAWVVALIVIAAIFIKLFLK